MVTEAVSDIDELLDAIEETYPAVDTVGVFVTLDFVNVNVLVPVETVAEVALNELGTVICPAGTVKATRSMLSKPVAGEIV